MAADFGSYWQSTELVMRNLNDSHGAKQSRSQASQSKHTIAVPGCAVW